MGGGRHDEGSSATPTPPSASSPVAVVTATDLTPGRHMGRWVAPLYLAMSLVLAPWTAMLLLTLPDRAVSHNYRLAWVGFDVLLMLSMGRTAWLAWRRSPYAVNVASATATLLVVDAWFDVTTAPTRGLLQACILAMFVELPAAVLSLIIAGRAQRLIARTGAAPPPPKLWQAWRRRHPRRIPPLEGAPPPRGLSAGT
jgi:hypothetical protein